MTEIVKPLRLFDLKITIVDGFKIPVGDIHGKSDGYIIAKIKNVKGLLSNTSDASNEPSPATRVHFRTSTKFNSRSPEWNETWQIGGVRKGTYIKLKLYDEDPRKALDDKLGSGKFDLDDPESILDLSIKDYKGSKHIQLLTHGYDLFHANAKGAKEADREESTIRVKPDKSSIYIRHPTRYSVHQSPLINMLTSAPSHVPDSSEANPRLSKDDKNRFKAYKIDLINIPSYLKDLTFSADPGHAKSFDPSKLKYRMAYRLIKKQHQSIYGHDMNTQYGQWWNDEDVGPGLVELLQPDIEKKLFTFVIMQRGEWRFCETGEEYKINKLSKHSMHADGSEEVSWGGEFFIRKTPVMDNDVQSHLQENAETLLEAATRKGHGPHSWTIFLDNDSGTYSPDEEKINTFREFMALNLQSLNVVVMNFEDQILQDAKKEQKSENLRIKKHLQ